MRGEREGGLKKASEEATVRGRSLSEVHRFSRSEPSRKATKDEARGEGREERTAAIVLACCCCYSGETVEEEEVWRRSREEVVVRGWGERRRRMSVFAEGDGGEILVGHHRSGGGENIWGREFVVPSGERDFGDRERSSDACSR